jgi:hypothetical protein
VNHIEFIFLLTTIAIHDNRKVSQKQKTLQRKSFMADIKKGNKTPSSQPPKAPQPQKPTHNPTKPGSSNTSKKGW